MTEREVPLERMETTDKTETMVRTVHRAILDKKEMKDQEDQMDPKDLLDLTEPKVCQELQE